MSELIVALLGWIGAHGGLAAPDVASLPRVRREAPEAIGALLAEDARRARWFQADDGGVVALYVADRNVIYIARDLDPADHYTRAVLVHELVHFLQYALGHDRKVQCPKELERDAYRIQARYMVAHGVPVDFDEYAVLLRSICYMSW